MWIQRNKNREHLVGRSAAKMCILQTHFSEQTYAQRPQTYTEGGAREREGETEGEGTWEREAA